MANKHTSAQREWIIERIAYGFSAQQICEKFAARFPDTKCEPVDVNSCDPSVVLLGPFEDTHFKRCVKYATENPEVVAPAMNPTRRQMQIIHMADWARDRNAVEIAGKLYRQVAEEQGAIAKPGDKGKAGDDKPAAPVTEVRRTLVRPKHPDQVAALQIAADKSGADA